MRVDYNRIAFYATIVLVAILVAIGKVPATSLTALLAAGGIGAWLLPSPLTPKAPPPSDDQGAS